MNDVVFMQGFLIDGRNVTDAWTETFTVAYMVVPSLIRMYGFIKIKKNGKKNSGSVFNYHHQAGQQEVLFLPTC